MDRSLRGGTSSVAGLEQELTWERTVKQAGSVPLSVIGSVLESMPGRVLENVLGVYFRVYLGACNEVHLAVLLNAA